MGVVESHFKCWAKPGPVPPGAIDPPEVPPDETLDAISGHFRLFQLRKGHRFSTDDVLDGVVRHELGAFSEDRAGPRVGDWVGRDDCRLAPPGARFVTIEAQADSVRLARKSAAYNGLAGRYEIRHADFRDAGALASGERFDLVLASPPYFPPGTGIEGDHPQKVACRFELRGDIADYARLAARTSWREACLRACFPRSSARAWRPPRVRRHW